MDAIVVMVQQGRVVIPEAVRRAFDLNPGDRLHLHAEHGRPVLQRHRDAVAELRALGSGIDPGRSLVDDLLAERRLEVERENAGA